MLCEDDGCGPKFSPAWTIANRATKPHNTYGPLALLYFLPRAYMKAPITRIASSSGRLKATFRQSPKPTFAEFPYSGRSGVCTIRSSTQCENDAAETSKTVLRRLPAANNP